MIKCKIQGVGINEINSIELDNSLTEKTLLRVMKYIYLNKKIIS